MNVRNETLSPETVAALAAALEKYDTVREVVLHDNNKFTHHGMEALGGLPVYRFKLSAEVEDVGAQVLPPTMLLIALIHSCHP